MKRRFHTLDVFTSRAFAGNPLAVVHDSEGLDGASMLAIAREFNLSETVFVLPPADPVNTARVRIFTPGGELPFAGHPTVGTGVLLALLRAPEMVGGAGIVIALEEEIGLVKVEVTRPQGRAARGVFGLPRLPERMDSSRDPALIAAALRLSDADVLTDGHEPAVFSAGVPFTTVPLASLEALARAASIAGPDFDAAFGAGGRGACYLYVRTGPAAWRTRMFGPGMGIVEDPATGAAAAAFAGALMAFEQMPNGERQHVITQGVEMGRPSDIVLTLQVEQGRLSGATIGGEAVIMSEGVLHA